MAQCFDGAVTPLVTPFEQRNPACLDIGCSIIAVTQVIPANGGAEFYEDCSGAVVTGTVVTCPPKVLVMNPVDQQLVLDELQSIKDATAERSQGEFFKTATNLEDETVGEFINRLYPSTIITNICYATITNKGPLPATIISAAGTEELESGATLILGIGIRKINNLDSFIFGAPNSFRIMWSELNA